MDSLDKQKRNRFILMWRPIARAVSSIIAYIKGKLGIEQKDPNVNILQRDQNLEVMSVSTHDLCNQEKLLSQVLQLHVMTIRGKIEKKLDIRNEMLYYIAHYVHRNANIDADKIRTLSN